MNIKKVAAYTLGCKVNQYETEGVLSIFREKGYEIVGFDEYADVYVINTCTVTGMSDRKNRQIIRKAVRNNPEGIVVVMGCYSQVAANEVAEIQGVDIITGTVDRNKIPEMVENYIISGKSIIDVKEGILRNNEFEEQSVHMMGGHTRAFVKIQDGCSQFCTYCIIPYARGPIRSRRLDSILPEVKALVGKGYKEIVLTGIHLSSYGKESDGKISLIDVVKAIAKVDGVCRIRLGSLEPMYFTQEVIESLANEGKFCRHFHLSLQSGSATVLERMNRCYTPEEYMDVVNLVCKNMPDASITTDVMTGFPGETEEEFIESIEFVKKVGFARIHVFPYSKRKGTLAAEMKNQVSGEVKKKRTDKMLEIASKMEENYIQYFMDKTIEVLLEDPSSKHENHMEGYTHNYIKVSVPASQSQRGSIVSVKIKMCFSDYCLGMVVAIL